MPKMRLDVYLLENGLVESRSLAQRLVMAGMVRVNGQLELKPSTSVNSDDEIILEQGPRFVSRGGEKLEAALQAFKIDVNGRICADVGASTGGFTDCLIQNGAKRVYAIDVGKGILHWKLRQMAEVVVMEQTNARYVEKLPEAVRFLSIDASFISLKTLLPVVKNWLAIPAEIVTLIKPQFEAGRKEVSRGDGVIRDPEIHRQVLLEILNFAQIHGFGTRGLIRSPILGPKGNVEFLAWFKVPSPDLDIKELVENAMIEL
jgi:23S rRNA (cytidine1920-2'-O)/16S rRNA (cytidine1409-2'-O)-methyltransferase